MSKVVDLISINSVIIGSHDTCDMVALGTFMIALSRTDLIKLGVRGNAEIEYHGGDYWLVFANGNIVGRPTTNGAVLLRRTKCPVCGRLTWSSTAKAEFCWEDEKDLLDLDEAKDVA